MITVILCTHNPKLALLDRVLDKLRRQTLPLTHWQLILVDNGSARQLADSVDLSWHPNARIIREPTLGLSIARRTGIRAAQHELLVFVDDDNLLAPDYLTQALAVSRQMGEMGVWNGSVVPEFESPPTPFVSKFVRFLGVSKIERAVWSNFEPVNASLPFGVGLCVRASVARAWATLGEIDLRHLRLGRIGNSLNSCEDWEIAATAIDHGMGMGRFPQLRATHVIAKERLRIGYLFRLAAAVEGSSQLFFALRNKRPIGPPRLFHFARGVAAALFRLSPGLIAEKLFLACAEFYGHSRAYMNNFYREPRVAPHESMKTFP